MEEKAVGAHAFGHRAFGEVGKDVGDGGGVAALALFERLARARVVVAGRVGAPGGGTAADDGMTVGSVGDHVPHGRLLRLEGGAGGQDDLTPSNKQDVLIALSEFA